MNDINQYDLLMEALAELKPEIETARRLTPVPAHPSLRQTLAEFGSMPGEAMFMGVASDGLPMLLNLHDPVPGPLLVLGDAGAGKTNLLRLIAQSAGMMHQPSNLQFGVVTNHPGEWNGMEKVPNNVGVFPLYAKSSEEFILSLASWAHGNKTSSQSVLLLLDDLEAATNLDFNARQNLRWLFLRGPARRVWPIVTINPSLLDAMHPWLDLFRTRIFGSIKDDGVTRRLGAREANLTTLNNGSEFALREVDQWLRFWLPSID
ncbi:MAG TPA: FtsK/SpoIIIE domain-containing protein [Anaerolineales bacterium]|jgi:hypothetical protein|nr:FtsK/SpoIIIE domain-containing protein [Anaerolineales bacterium]